MEEKLSDAESGRRKADPELNDRVTELAEELRTQLVAVGRPDAPGTLAVDVATTVSDAKHVVGDIQRRRREAEERAARADKATEDGCCAAISGRSSTSDISNAGQRRHG